ncbi:hypothetical protein BCV70DRAFT_197227 [Testicularia cyperi]|uniref:Uncharacterized protein n=1 Tax=Testicularia cyperi TaxID=1882483 RepID=A0A317XYI4_9BASI|nr:hypothetical protein BCV70DRAFT_197227 [Testicularia cyperi]
MAPILLIGLVGLCRHCKPPNRSRPLSLAWSGKGDTASWRQQRPPLSLTARKQPINAGAVEACLFECFDALARLQYAFLARESRDEGVY